MARTRPLQCPFCDNYLSPPVDIRMKSLEITGGICTCGAVFALDRAGHNLGEVFLDALTFACKGNIDRSITCMPEDYETETLDYDIHTNSLRPRGGGRGRGGKLIFVRLKNQ